MKLHILSQLKRQVYILKRERSGLLTLLAVLLFYFGWMDGVSKHTPPPGPSEDVIARYVHAAEVPTDDARYERREGRTYPKDVKEEAFFRFSPNTVAHGDLVRLGLSDKQAAAFIRYRERSKGFGSVEDVAKVFVVSEEWLARHRDDMEFHPDELHVLGAQTDELANNQRHPSDAKKEEQPIALIDINTADSLALVSIRGIGGASAQRILAYRDRLGGFYSIEQYAEIYGLHPEVRKVLCASTAPLTPHAKLDLNRADSEVLGKHPYIRYKLAKSLVAMRGHRGRLDTTDLRSHHLINDSVYERILPYIHVETP
jgi:DNA uptake protein ComE-like DNA-binding protein